jgi:hypothetical protein
VYTDDIFISTKKLTKMSFKLSALSVSLNILFIFILKNSEVTAQVINDSGTIRIMKGGSVVSMGNFTNAAGTIMNDGRLEVRGNFNNADKYISTSKQDSLVLTGTGTVTLNNGPAMLANLHINKTDGGGVTLAANSAVAATFNLQSGTFSTNPDKSYELIAPASATFTFAAGTFLTGKVRRTNWVNDSVIVFHQPGMMVKTSGGTPPVSLLVNMIPGKEPTASEKGVKRYFYFSPVGGHDYTADITFPYSPDELNTNNEANLVAWYHDRFNKWDQKLAGNTANSASGYVVSAGIKANVLADREWKLAEMNYNNLNPDLFVYPIPARSALNIYLAAEKNKKVAITLSDVSGKVCKILQKDLQKGLNKISINVTGLSSGQYILKVAEGNTVQTKVVLISK